VRKNKIVLKSRHMLTSMFWKSLN